MEVDFNDMFEELFIVTHASYFQIDIITSIVFNKVKLGEPVVRDFNNFKMLTNVPFCLIDFAKKILSYMGEDRVNLSLDAWKLAKSTNRMFLLKKRVRLVEKIQERLEKLGVEVFLAPGFATPAIKHDHF